MKALLKNYRQSPQKVRLVANLIRGKSIPAARTALTFLAKKSSPAILQLLNSAVANAQSQGISTDDLYVSAIAVNKGAVLKRFKPMARGRAAQFHRTMSIITLELGANPKPKKGKAVKAVESTEVKKTAKPRTKKAKAVATK